MFSFIAEKINIGINQVASTVKLLDTDNTVPFISRYRKEATGNLDEDQIRYIRDKIAYLRNLESRKKTVLKNIYEQGKLTPELEKKIKESTKLQEIEDLYRPYRPKRRTRATMAKEKGLEPLAQLILEQKILSGDPLQIASDFINADKKVETVEDALQGARDIVAEAVSDDADIRKTIRNLTIKQGLMCSKAVEDKAEKDYEIYLDYSEPVKTIPPHRILALNRGEKETMLRVWIEISEEDMINKIQKIRILSEESIFTPDYIKAIEDAYQRLILPAIQRDVRKFLTEKTNSHAINVFCENLRALLMTPPISNKRILGIDPGYRTGCKVAVIDETGKYLSGETIYPHPPQKKWDASRQTLKNIIEEFSIDLIAVGNGTASRETEKLVTEVISQLRRNIHYIIVSEAGASVYSASKIAKKEFPELEASMRGNISIARRVLDPLSELVKIDPKSIGVGLYQHDVDQIKLAKALDQVVESCVNKVGIDLNTSSSSLLKYVSGINSRVADNIVKYREENGRFTSRNDLNTIKGIGQNCFIQSAGFMRIPDSDIFFDRTAVHPESYSSAQRLLSLLKVNITDVKADGTVLNKIIKSKELSISSLATQCECGIETLIDIIECLEKPNRDPRDKMDAPILRNDILNIDDLYEGLVLKGTVRNVVDFGAFVDIGVKQDGLVHISNLSDKYIKHPLDIVTVGDVVEVKILMIDKERGRIGLSMIY